MIALLLLAYFPVALILGSAVGKLIETRDPYDDNSPPLG
jgi:hypothetical protein